MLPDGTHPNWMNCVSTYMLRQVVHHPLNCLSAWKGKLENSSDQLTGANNETPENGETHLSEIFVEQSA